MTNRSECVRNVLLSTAHLEGVDSGRIVVKIAGYNIKLWVNLQQKHWDQHASKYTHHSICIVSECVRRGGGLSTKNCGEKTKLNA